MQISLGALTLLLFAGSGLATQVMHRPDRYKSTPNVYPLEANPKVTTSFASGKVNGAYFTNWGIYGANYQPQDIPVNTLTHILYSFADTDATTGTIKLTDPYADEQKRYPGDSWDETGNNVYGCLKQLYLLKLKNRNLKVILSIGGWTYSQAGHFNFVTSASARANFVSSAIQLVKDYGFDGIDVDYEYPSSPALGQGFADLLTATRTALNSLAASNKDTVPYQLSVAVAAGAANYAYYVVPQMNAALDYWNLMAYDYAGSWLNFTDHQANVYGGTRTNVSTDQALSWYFSKGASASKISLGLPIYGRAFENTAGVGQPYSGIGPGTTEAGIYSYKALPLAGAQVFQDTKELTSWSYDAAKREFVSYDTPAIIKLKTQWANSKNLAGTFFWELSTDKTGSESLVSTTANALGGLDQTKNHINYPNSKWDNIRNNMGGGGGTTTTTSGGPGPTGGSCGGVSAWSASAVYTGGQKASYGGRLWTAKWWTQGETPGAVTSADVWTNSGSCT
ncbi:glycoside hydrolase superfamily [Pterulicium gracile]|uniref:chitinase n=1 Tax=Pterulicium gracile TaxID=1884261 RepID=A0A5C3Q6K4_9AGAR|nr:glycoside hydrolase superfamily [Pterula gracilis]